MFCETGTMQSSSLWQATIRLSLTCLLIATSLKGIGFACVSPAARVKGVAEGIRAALNAYAADSEGNRFPPTAEIAQYTELARLANDNGATLPATEPRTEPRLSVWRRELRSLINDLFGSVGCDGSVCPPGLWSFTSYRASDDGHDYTLTLQVENANKAIFVIITPEGVNTQYGVATSSSTSSSEP